ncbi:MAG: CPBP family intramembrane metalloprotease [Pseudobutyrivibrio sp.]|nr:CPBP family intramembrane metalloprotease [Pseudobutyrivibrio sp.]
MNKKNAEKKKYIPWIFIPCVVVYILEFVLTIFVMQGSIVYAIGTFDGNTWDELVDYVMDIVMSSATDGWIFVLYSSIGIVLFSICYHRMFMEGKTYRLKGISKNVPMTVGGLVLLCIGMQYVSEFLMDSLSAAFPSWLEEYIEIFEAAGFDGDVSLLLILYVLLLGPIVEEIIFRGIVYSAAKKVMPYYFAIIVQALLFGAFHMNPIQSCYAFVLGLGMGYVMYLYDNLLLSIIIHISYNIMGVFFSGTISFGEGNIVGFFFYTLFALVVTYIGLLLLKKGANSVKEEENLADI